MRHLAVVGFGGRVAGGLLATVRFSVAGKPHRTAPGAPEAPTLYALWHSRLLPLSYFHRNWNLSTLISQSADGEYIARLVQRWGYSVIRGSSSRGGGPAFRNLLRALRAGRSVAITPDGPRGPREKVKPGIVLAAQLSGSSIIPVGAGADRCWWVEGWDRFMVPKPFARISVVYGEALSLGRDAPAGDVESLTERLESELVSLNEEAERRVAH